jgi:hypothetical protein
MARAVRHELLNQLIWAAGVNGRPLQKNEELTESVFDHCLREEDYDIQRASDSVAKPFDFLITRSETARAAPPNGFLPPFN